ncbi:hypothetical protein NN561_001041 [Cricetulus griseus]
MLLAWLLLSFCMTALQLVSSSSSKSFYRVDEPRTWKEAMWYCQEHYTDLADLQSMNSPVSIMDVYSYTSNTQAWIGLFYDVRISGLRWSSGSIFTTPTWTVLPVFQDGICATLYSLLMAPVLGAASCTAKKPFICYYDHAVGHRISLVSPLEELTTLPREAEVKIGEQTFIRIKQTMSWLSALIYCRNHYTDLADLQKVTDKEGKETLHSITNDVDAWIGLYFNVKTNNLTWSSDLGSSIPEWLQTIPVFGQGLCAGLRIFSNAPPQIYALLCHELKPFICFWGSSTDPEDASQALVSATWIRQQVSHEPIEASSGTCVFGTCDTTTPAPSTVGLTALQPQGAVSISPLVTPASLGEYSFGVLKADFTISTLKDPEEMKDQFLSEIQEVLKFVLGHEEFTLKWIGLEVNKK